MPDASEQLRALVKEMHPKLGFDMVQTPDHDLYQLILHYRAKNVREVTGLEMTSLEQVAREVGSMVTDLDALVYDDFAFGRQAEIARTRRDEAWENAMLSTLMSSGVLYYEAVEIVKRIKEGLPK